MEIRHINNLWLLCFDLEDVDIIKDIWNIWLSLNKEIGNLPSQVNFSEEVPKSILDKIARKVNLPEFISEGFWCLYNLKYKHYQVCRIIEGHSADTINISQNPPIYQQIKASIVDEDLTSFGPKSKFDELYFLDFSRLDGSVDIYQLDFEEIKKIVVNRKKGETFEMQQQQGRRPRLSLKKLIQSQPQIVLWSDKNVRLWEE
jgi:hypothetical protein